MIWSGVSVAGSTLGRSGIDRDLQAHGIQTQHRREEFDGSDKKGLGGSGTRRHHPHCHNMVMVGGDNMTRPEVGNHHRQCSNVWTTAEKARPAILKSRCSHGLQRLINAQSRLAMDTGATAMHISG